MSEEYKNIRIGTFCENCRQPMCVCSNIDMDALRMKVIAPSMPELKSFNFKMMRTLSGLTLREVEKKTGISNSYLSQLESGKIKEPSYNTIRTLTMLYNKLIYP